MTDLMTHTLHEKKIKNAFSEGISYSIHNLLDDKDTNNKLKNFLYYQAKSFRSVLKNFLL